MATRNELINQAANLWASRLTRQEAASILGPEALEWTREDILQGLYCWRYDWLSELDTREIAMSLQVEQNYVQYRMARESEVYNSGNS